MKSLFKHSTIYALTALFLLAGCKSVPRIVSEHKIDIQQGNVVTKEMVAQLKLGLTKDQVRFILGSPLLTDTFHANRWDYVYRLKKGKTGQVETQQLAIFFDENDKLERYVGDVILSEETEADKAVEAKSESVAVSDEAATASNTAIGKNAAEAPATDNTATLVSEDKPIAADGDAVPEATIASGDEAQNVNIDKPVTKQNTLRTQQGRKVKEIDLGSIDEESSAKEDGRTKPPTQEDSWLWGNK